MKQNKIKNLLLTILALLLGAPAFAQVGMGTGSPKGVLDVKDTMGIVLPKVQSVDSVKTPDGEEAVIGTLVYDLSKSCARVKNSKGWSDCLLDSRGKDSIIFKTLGLGENFVVAKASVSNNWIILLGKGDHGVYFSGTNSNGVSGLGRAGGGVRSYTLVRANPPMRDIAAGLDHAIAADSIGRVWTWGANANYRTGQQNPGGTYVNGSYTSLPDSCDFFGPKKGAGYLAKLVAASNATSLVVTDNGDVYSIGTAPANGISTAAANVWTKVGVPAKVKQIAASLNNTVGVVTETGEAYVWGTGGYNGLGNGGTTTSNTPYKLNISEKVGKIAMGYQCGAAITEDGTKLYAWGYQNTVANSTNLTVPTDITNKIQLFDASKGDRIVDVGLARGNGGNITVIVNNTTTGESKVYAAGRNNYGHLGVGNTTNQNATGANAQSVLRPISLQKIDKGTKFIGVASGGYNTILITDANPTNGSLSYVAYGAGRTSAYYYYRVLGAITSNALYYTPLTK